jgi:hypothetical protein
MSTYDIYTPCDECPLPHQLIENIGNAYTAVTNVGIEITNALTAQVSLLTREVADLVKRARSPLRRTMDANNNVLGTVIEDITAMLSTANVENRATLNQLIVQLQQIEDSNAAATSSQAPATSTTVPPVVTSSAPAGVTGSTTQLQHTMSPLPIDPCEGKAIAKYLGAITQWTLTAVYSDGQGGLLIDQAGLHSQIAAWLQASALCPEPEKVVKPPDLQHPTKPFRSADTFPSVPVDLDQPLAFKFASDDSPWKAQAEAFYGGWLSDWDAAATLNELFSARDAQSADDIAKQKDASKWPV